MEPIPFNRPYFGDRDFELAREAFSNGHTAGNGPFTKCAENMLNEVHGPTTTSLLTTSCTHALELCARLMDLKPGDEVIVPSYSFVSTASAFVWNGARPVFADIRPDTLNIDPTHVESLITDRTRAICIVHYGGVAAEPERFVEIAERHSLFLVEDNAHGLGGRSNGRLLGTFGQFSTLSFHETKNITCGEGGALVINDSRYVERAEILRDKGTNRSQFLRGQTDKYTWVDVGSSWVMSDILAAILVAQLERMNEVQNSRLDTWNRYLNALRPWATERGYRLPVIPPGCDHTGHVFHLRLKNLNERDAFIDHMKFGGVNCVFHYQPLSTSPAGQRLSASLSDLPESSHAARTLVRLPLWFGITEPEIERIVLHAASFQT